MKHLTHIHDNVSRDQIEATYKGMAHWAGSGPPGRTCRECEFWQNGGAYRYSHGSQQLKPATCAKYAELAGGKNFKRGFIPFHAKACRHFAEKANPPTIARRL